MDNQNTVVTDVKEIVEKYFEPRILPAEGTGGLVIAPQGMSVKHVKDFVDKERIAPEILKGTTALHTCDSFIEFANRYKSDNSAIFYSKQQQKITCIFDCATKEQASFEQHKAVYAFPFSKELQAWANNNGEKMSQLNFAMFIEQNVLDLAEPPAPDKESPALKEIRMRCGGFYAPVNKMIELSKGIAVRADERAVIKHDLNTGEATINFSSEHTDVNGDAVKVPNMFVIVIPVLEGGKAYQLPCRLRYRLNNGSVIWWYEVINLDKAIELAVNEELEAIKEKIGLPVYYGDLPQGR